MNKRIFAVLFITVFASMLGLSIIQPILPIYARDIGATGLWLGIIVSAFSLSKLLFMPLIGRISDRKGRKSVICIGLLSYSVISLLYIWSQTAIGLSGIRFLHGITSAMIFPIATAYVGDIAPEKELGKYMGTFNIHHFLGLGAGPFLGGVIENYFGMKAAFYFMGALAACALFLVLFLIPESTVTITKDVKVPYSKILKNRILKGLVSYRCVNHVAIAMKSTFLPLYGVFIGLSIFQVGIILSTGLLLNSLLQIPFGFVADRCNKVRLVIVGSVIGIAALAFIPFTNNFIELLVVNVISGIGGAMAAPSSAAMVSKVGKVLGMGAVMGIFNSAVSVGMIVGSLISGLVFDFAGLVFVFYSMAVLRGCGAILFYKFVES